MKPQIINEPIEVIAYFRTGEIQPLRIRWKSKVYKVREVYSSWVEGKGIDLITHIGCKVDSKENFDLLYDNNSFTWKLEKLYPKP